MAEPGKGVASATLVAVIAAITSLVSAGSSAWQNREARKLQQQLADRQEAAEAAFKLRESTLKQLELDRDYQLGVVERVADALEKASTAPNQVNVASALLYTLPDGELKERLIVVVLGEAQRAAEKGTVLDSSVASLRGSVRDNAVVVETPAPAQQPVGSAGPTPAGSSSARPQTVDLVASPSATGWDVDVFWCATSGGRAGAGNKARAELAANLLASTSRTGATLEGERLGRVRLRELTAEANARPQYGLSADQIFLDAGEDKIGRAVAEAVRAAGAPLDIVNRQGGRVSPWYLSAFYCAGVSD